MECILSKGLGACSLSSKKYFALPPRKQHPLLLPVLGGGPARPQQDRGKDGVSVGPGKGVAGLTLCDEWSEKEERVEGKHRCIFRKCSGLLTDFLSQGGKVFF